MDSPLKGSGGLVILEKISEIRWTLQMTQAMLFADLALLWWTNDGILGWSASTDELVSNFGLLAVHVLVYGILVSIVIPLGSTITSHIILKVKNSTSNDKRDEGYVYSWEVQYIAIKDSNSVYMDIYNRLTKRRFNRIKLSELLFAVLVLEIADLFAPALFQIDGLSLMGHLILLFDSQSTLVKLFAFVLVFVAFLPVGVFIWNEWSEDDFIYHPLLHDKVKEEERRIRSAIHAATSSH